jgi:DNA end-binding protein Ku
VVIIRPVREGMVMHQLFFKDEIRTIKEIPLGDTPELAAGELKLAKALIEQSTAKRFDPNEFHDEFRERVEAAIQKKIKSGKEISYFETPEAAPEGMGNVVDLMEVLQRSLSKGGAGAKAAAGAKTAPGARATSARKPPRRVTAARKTRAASRSA